MTWTEAWHLLAWGAGTCYVTIAILFYVGAVIQAPYLWRKAFLSAVIWLPLVIWATSDPPTDKPKKKRRHHRHSLPTNVRRLTAAEAIELSREDPELVRATVKDSLMSMVLVSCDRTYRDYPGAAWDDYLTEAITVLNDAIRDPDMKVL